MSTQSSQFSSTKEGKGRAKKHEDQIFKADVITLVKPLGCLYDNKHKDFDDDDAVTDAWQIVVDGCKEKYPDDEVELLHRVQRAWENCKKAFSKERSRREQPCSTNTQGWSLYDHMAFMDQHMRRIPKTRLEHSKQTTKKRKLAEGTQSQRKTGRNDLSDTDNEQASQKDLFQEDEDYFELERRERHLKVLEEQANKAKLLDLKAAQLEAEREDARRRSEMLHEEREQRKRDREAREQDLKQQAKKKDSEKSLIKVTAEHVVATLDSMESEEDRRRMIEKIMNILYSE